MEYTYVYITTCMYIYVRGVWCLWQTCAHLYVTVSCCQVGVADGGSGTGNGVQAQELAAKIAENAELNLKVHEKLQYMHTIAHYNIPKGATEGLSRD